MTQLLKTLGTHSVVSRFCQEESGTGAVPACGTQRRCYAKGEAAVARGRPGRRAWRWCFRAASALITDDAWGNTQVCWTVVGPGQVFAETYACVPG